MSGDRSPHEGTDATPIDGGVALDDPILFLSEAGIRIWSAHDADACIQRLAQALVPSLADWCVVGLWGDAIAACEFRGDASSRAANGATASLLGEGQRRSSAGCGRWRVAVACASWTGDGPTVTLTTNLPDDGALVPLERQLLERVLGSGIECGFSNGQVFGGGWPSLDLEGGLPLEGCAEATAAAQAVTGAAAEAIAAAAGRDVASAAAEAITAAVGEGVARPPYGPAGSFAGMWCRRPAEMAVVAAGTHPGGRGEARRPVQATHRAAPDAELLAELRAALHAAGVQSFVVVPLQAFGRTLGAVLLGSCRSGRAYGSRETALLRMLASYTAAAVEYLRVRAALEESRRLLEEEQQLRTVIAQTVGEGLLILDHSGRLRYANAAAQKKLGWTEAEMLGRSADEVLRRCRDSETVQTSPWRCVLRTGQQARCTEQVFIRKCGLPLHVWVTATPLVRDHQVNGAVVAFRNVTSLKETQRRVEQLNAQLAEVMPLRTAELVEANRELEAFAYSVSHDLRAPLRTINGFSQALLEDYGDTLDETARDYLVRLKAASERMGELIDALLSLARVTRAELTREEVDLSALASGIARQLQRNEPERLVEFRIQPNLKVRGDGALLRIALENLLGNAWKFTRRRARAVIEVGETVIDGQRTFFVRDNGVGFDMRYADKLFGAFQRLHSSHEFEGTGIGLATVQRIVRRHGGKIWGVGVVEGGATFYFTIHPDGAP